MTQASFASFAWSRFSLHRLHDRTRLVVAIVFLGCISSVWSCPAAQGDDICSSLTKRKTDPLYGHGFPALSARENLTPQEMVDGILTSSGLRRTSGTPEQITAIATSDYEVHGNAEAKICDDGKEYVFYDPDYFASLGRGYGTPWAQYFLMAHEIGHHLHNHVLNGVGDALELEANADRFAAFALARMGASQQDLIAAVDSIADENDLVHHPGRVKREAAVRDGYQEYVNGLTAQHMVGSSPQPTPPIVPWLTTESTTSVCDATHGDLAYQSKCNSCERQRAQILNQERNGTIDHLGRTSFYNACTWEHIDLPMPVPSRSATLSQNDIRDCMNGRISIANLESRGQTPPATMSKIRGAYAAGYCERAESQPTPICQTYMKQWAERGNYQYPEAQHRYEAALLQTLRANGCPGF
jgi:hypothetical protein